MSAQCRGGDGAGKQQEITWLRQKGAQQSCLCACPPVTTLKVPPPLTPPSPPHEPQNYKKGSQKRNRAQNLVTRHPHRARSLPIFHTELSPTSHTEHCRGLALRVPGLHDVVDLGQGTRRGGLCVDGAHEWQHDSWSRGKGRVCVCENKVCWTPIRAKK
jgi:hypothetical protein